MVRFTIPVWPRDGAKPRHLTIDREWAVTPRVGDTVLVDDDSGVAFDVHSVTFSPTADPPAVYVTCRIHFSDTAREADALVEAAVKKGWYVR